MSDASGGAGGSGEDECCCCIDWSLSTATPAPSLSPAASAVKSDADGLVLIFGFQEEDFAAGTILDDDDDDGEDVEAIVNSFKLTSAAGTVDDDTVVDCKDCIGMLSCS